MLANSVSPPVSATAWALSIVAMIGMSSVQPSMCQSKVPRKVPRRGVLRRVERHPEDLGELAVAEDLDLAELPAEGDLGGVVEVEVVEDQHAVGVEGVEAGRGQVVVGAHALGVDVGDLGPDRGAELLGRDDGHALLLR